jgi:hypothetical protein
VALSHTALVPPLPEAESLHPAPRRNPLLAAVWGFVVLLLISSALYMALYIADFRGTGVSLAQLLTAPGTIGPLTSFAEVTVGVLGIAITVVAIIVELAANRYTPRITELFLSDPTNQLVLSFFVVTSVVILWIGMSLHGSVFPVAMPVAATLLMSMSLLAILPYFAYVFDFLSPVRVIDRIRHTGSSRVRSLAKRGERAVPGAHAEVVRAVEQLGDIALNSVDKKDKPLTFACLDALGDIARTHVEEKPNLPDSWFESGRLVRNDQDFVALHPDMVRALAARRNWLEMKVLRQYQAVFSESVNRLRDVNHLVAIHTRRLATFAHRQGDEHTVNLSLRFLNTYMRASVNGRDVRTAYNLLNEYRHLGETMLAADRPDRVMELANKIKFYGQLAFASQLGFILETAAYDLCALLERAHAREAPCHDALLDLFLDVDREPEGGRIQEASLRGVRKAQVKLATYYLNAGAQEPARRIFEDMHAEQVSRLRSIRDELLAVDDAEYWEVVDRGINFDYLPAPRRAQLATFFSWFPSL